MSGIGYGVLGALTFVLFGWGVIKIMMWSAKREGIELAHNEILKAGAKTDAETQDIMARPPADKPAIVDWMRESR